MEFVKVSLSLVDHLLRRWILPLTLLAASFIRYNLFSFSYLLLFIIGIVIPSPRLKSQRVSSIVYQSVIVGCSLVYALGQAGFQISLATDFNLSTCETLEIILRQSGLILYKVPAIDIVRHLLPDVVVLVVAIATLVITIIVAFLHAKETTPTESSQLSTNSRPPLLQQKYFKLPIWSLVFLDILIYVFFLFSGVIVPSITTFVYFSVFLCLSLLWSFHLKFASFIRLLRVGSLFYVCLHLLCLYLYQFQSFQSSLPLEPTNHVHSLIARLLGLTPIIKTNCSRPTELLIFQDTPITYYIYPWALIGLLWLLATDCQFWLTTPKNLWLRDSTYYIPLLITSGRSSQEATPTTPTVAQYGSIETSSTPVIETSLTVAKDDPHPKEKESISSFTRRRKYSLNNLWTRFTTRVQELAILIMSVNYIFSLIAMMVWSVLYPSWLALVLLLWACVIWCIPRISPKRSFYLTSPFLLLYAICLVLMQYVHSLFLTSSELNWDVAIGTECSHTRLSKLQDCRSSVLAVKSLLSLAFCASVHELVKEFKSAGEEGSGRGSRRSHQAIPGDEPLLGVIEEDSQLERTEGEEQLSTIALLNIQIQVILKSYWILVVVSAFLLVILAGDASLLKSVYVLFFFIFLFFYQVSQRWWLHLNFPFWCFLILYSSFHLVLVYTFPFREINNLWISAYNASSLNISAKELFDAIGFVHYTPDSTSPRSLFLVLVPLVIFIAALVLQLRYFTPCLPLCNSREAEQEGVEPTLSFGRFVNQIANRLSRSEHDIEKLADDTTKEENIKETREEDEESDDSDSPTVPKEITIYKAIVFVLVLLRKMIIKLWHLLWRFSEIHLHKVIMLCLFILSVYEVSLAYFLLAIFVIILTPFPLLASVGYMVMTLYIGVVVLAKFLFQIQLIESFMFHKECDNITSYIKESFNYTYSPVHEDSSWLGLNKAAGQTAYIMAPLLISLLITFWFSARRHQNFHNAKHNIIIEPWDINSLFPGVKENHAHYFWLDAIKYLINHFFEMYGVEVCLIVQAIVVAIRIDTYGVLAAALLGIMLVVPRYAMKIPWTIICVIQAVLIVTQYMALLGVPPSVLCENNYPWVFTNISYKIKLQKWLYLPYRGTDILDKYWLLAYVISYICMSRQLRYFVRNPLDSLVRLNPARYPSMNNAKAFLDYLKIFIFKYFFWFTLFMVFVAGAFGLDLFGFFYLLSCFIYLYRGQDLLTDSRKTRKKWWEGLRSVTYVILLIRIMIELVGCVYIDDLDIKNRCVLIGLFNLRCSHAPYYGITRNVECINGTQSSTGLWLDVISFSVLVLQRILCDTTYADQVESDIADKEANAVNFATIMKDVLKTSKEAKEEQMKQDLRDLEERAEALRDSLQLQDGAIAQVLHAGTRIPTNLTCQYSLEKSPKQDHTSLEDTPILSEQVQSKEEAKRKTELSKLKRLGNFLLTIWLSIVDYIINWFEDTSSSYIQVLQRLERAREGTIREAFEEEEEEEDKDETTPSLATSIGATPTTAIPTRSSSKQESITNLDIEGATPISKTTPICVTTPITETIFSDSDKKAKFKNGRASTKSITFADVSSNFDETGDVILESLKLHPSRSEEEQAREVSSRLEELSSEYTKRPKRFLKALYYWILSHFEFVVFFFIIVVILRTGSLISFVYAGLLFMWALLYVPWPSKRFWLTLLFLTMFVLLLKYVYYFVYITLFDTTDNGKKFLGLQSDGFSWVFGIQIEASYFSNSVTHLILLMTIIFHRGLMKQYGLWHSTTTLWNGTNFVKNTLRSIYNFFKTLLSSSVVAGNKDYYIWILTFDVLCFVTIVLGYSQFTVYTAGDSDIADVRQVATFIQSNNVPPFFLAMLFLQFLSMLIDRAIYIRHSIVAKFIFYVILLIAWHVWLLIALPAITDRAFIHNSAAQTIYFFKSLYFILSALQMISGYPVRLLGYFVGKNYSTVAGVIFMGYRLIPILPELREVMDWVFTDTSLSLFNWLRVQEIWSTLYEIKVRRQREQASPRDLGDQQSIIIKLLMGGAFLVALVLLIWGPLLVISLINQTGAPNPPIFASLQVNLEGYQLLDIQAQSSFISPLTESQFDELRNDISTPSIQREFNNLFKQENFRRILFPGNSSLLWTASEPSQIQLKEQLSKNVSHKLNCIWTLRRSPSSGAAIEVITGNRQTTLNTEVVQQFIDNLNGNLTLINLTNLYPTFVSAPANDMSIAFTSLSNHIRQTSRSPYVNCSAKLNQTHTDTNITINQWWTLTQSSRYVLMENGAENGALEMIVHSDPVVPPIFSYISNLGIIGLYVSVVLVISKFVRNYVNSLALDIMIDQIPYPDRLLELCDDIFNVREAKNFILEEVLVGRLIYIFRSPQKLLELTEIPKTKCD